MRVRNAYIPMYLGDIRRHNDKNIFNPFMFGQAKFIYFNMEEFNA